MATGKTIGVTSAAALVVLLAATIGLPVLTVSGLFDRPELGFGPSAASLDGVPPVAADAYQRAAAAAPSFSPPCSVPASLLAGVGEVESGHGTHGGATVSGNGDVRPPIVGIPLPQLGEDTDGGSWDGSTTVDHAVGPMQFIPSTWRAYGADGNDDGATDPHNLYDAALAAARYLCASGSPMATESDWRRGLWAYNHSEAYADDVIKAARRYEPAETSPTSGTGDVQLVEVEGIGPTNIVWAHQVRSLLAAAAADGVPLTGSSYRNPDEQIALRKAHCGNSHHAIYEMPSSQCSPPTARPGTSQHEQGLAIDFDACSTRATACWRWLSAHASSFGIHPLSSEPWHWSIDGR
ncbi:D-alanyl-D-alanine carboxypeptidase family protein [Iamia majanohamensis]|uniref:D-alanyl-D-alanine carboxypeptidase family protein n=1 Tax=Iamia majanohamensis TaxID=467976 RepID=A0AAE9Y877_9ACTN|nr:D-alanyl-D-alanine carboxypeptidase family protein [Iamia majanohamensis]WCO66258.1 D-alanyl-D-alanine carboxypeptidase family protein [Iamia majanohamensis]